MGKMAEEDGKDLEDLKDEQQYMEIWNINSTLLISYSYFYDIPKYESLHICL